MNKIVTKIASPSRSTLYRSTCSSKGSLLSLYYASYLKPLQIILHLPASQKKRASSFHWKYHLVHFHYPHYNIFQVRALVVLGIAFIMNSYGVFCRSSSLDRIFTCFIPLKFHSSISLFNFLFSTSFWHSSVPVSTHLGWGKMNLLSFIFSVLPTASWVSLLPLLYSSLPEYYKQKHASVFLICWKWNDTVRKLRALFFNIVSLNLFGLPVFHPTRSFDLVTLSATSAPPMTSENSLASPFTSGTIHFHH